MEGAITFLLGLSLSLTHTHTHCALATIDPSSKTKARVARCKDSHLRGGESPNETR